MSIQLAGIGLHASRRHILNATKCRTSARGFFHTSTFIDLLAQVMFATYATSGVLLCAQLSYNIVTQNMFPKELRPR